MVLDTIGDTTIRKELGNNVRDLVSLSSDHIPPEVPLNELQKPHQAAIRTNAILDVGP